ncbi:MAG: M56 family metallopeptidase [Litoreibacter sp.]|uniref:M56 family metallopeptidase n=1 Tax=Litoreibacter sp. TaxID=1969459 RepID=UPI00329880AB
MTAEKLFSAYIDANIILAAVAAIWMISKFAIAKSRWRGSFLTQLNLLYAVLVTVVLAPIVVLASDAINWFGMSSPAQGFSFSDFLVAQYLHGNIAMAPTKFEQLLMLRTELTHEAVNLSTWVSYTILGALGAGFFAASLRNAKNIWRMSGMIHRSYVQRRIGRIDIRITHEARVPFSTRGIWRHYIVLPSELLTQADDVRIAVSHEIQHVRQRDLIWEIALELCRPIFFWNPAFIYCKREVERMRELACDQQVLRRGVFAIRAYCECLLRVCRTSLSADRSNQIMTPSVPFAQLDGHACSSKSMAFLKRRVESILDASTKDAGRWYIVLLMIPVFAIVVNASIAMRAPSDWSQDRLMLSAIVNLERLNNRSQSN